MTADTNPPDWVPHKYEVVSYSDGETTLGRNAIDFFRVLDIGVASLHMHDQDESVAAARDETVTAPAGGADAAAARETG